ncbi:tetratricopeptide repeat protein [Parasphingorhabdus sp.]|uniref:tetratricopeptide repeat protein n=1 Tax=Parasphingorhabdus sp. TaxID=2709688 RepID=UPI003D27F1A3
MVRLSLLSYIVPMTLGLTACSVDGRSAEARAYASFEDRHYLDTRVHLANAIDEDPDNPELRRLLGKTALALGDGLVAETAFRKAVEKDDTLAADVNRYLAHAHLLQGETEEALALLDEMQDSKTYTLRLLAQARLQSGALTEAWEAIERAIATAPDDANILSLAGQYQLSVGNIAEAERYARRALASPERSVEAYLLMGRMHSIRGDLEQALEQYDAGTKHFRDHVRLYIAQAAAHADRLDKEKMQNAIANVERIAPGHPGAIYISARYALNQGETDRAYKLAQRLEGASQNNPPLLLLLGQVQIERGNIEQAIGHLRAFLHLSPRHAAASLFLANALEKKGDSRQAFDVIAQAASRASSPKTIVAYAAHLAGKTDDPSAALLARRAKAPLLGEAEDQLARTQKAMDADEWQSAANIYDRLAAGDFADHSMILNNAAMAHLRAGNDRRALELAEQAYELTPDDPSVLDSVGWIRLNVAEDRRGSVEILRRAFQLDPGNMQIRLHLAQALAINGSKAEARKHLERLMVVVDEAHKKPLKAVLAQL